MSVAQRRINKISKSNSRKDFVELLAKREQVGMGRLRLMERRQVNKWQGSEGGCHFEGGEDSFSLSDGLSTLVHVLYQNGPGPFEQLLLQNDETGRQRRKEHGIFGYAKNLKEVPA